MPIRTIQPSGVNYHLICYDADARERDGDPDGVMSQRVLEAVQREPITDVFLISHGWLGDIKDAIRQYDLWIGAMVAHTKDLERMRQARPGFRPLMVGVHWPSKPFGEEDVSQSASFAAPSGSEVSPVDALIDDAAASVANTPAARQALQTIIAAAMEDVAPTRMPAEVADAYRALERETQLASGDATADPSSDREPFDPETMFAAANEESASFEGFALGALLMPLRLMSYWKMKDRAAKFGAHGAYPLLCRLQQAAGANVRFHLVGHSFGCVVMSATLAGPPTNNALVRPLDSVSLLQGAISLWSYTSDIPYAPGQPGHFRRIFSERRVAGPFITTQSEFDTAVGTQYPLASGVARQFSFGPAELPKYGALGTFGARGPGLDIVDLDMLPADGDYGFEAGKIYNLNSSQYICTMENRSSGAHNDLAHPEVAHAVWEAARCGL